MMIENFVKYFTGKVATFDEYCEYMIENLCIDPRRFLSKIPENKVASEAWLYMGFVYEGKMIKCSIDILNGINRVRYIHFLDIKVRD